MNKYSKTVRNIKNLAYLNCHPHVESLRANVLEGLATSPKRIASKFLYDKLGSELFDQICSQPEYYQTNAELEILEAHAKDMMVGGLAKPSLLIEFGSGHCRKIRFLLDLLAPGSQFVPLDISGDYLLDQAEIIAKAYPKLQVTAVCADFLQPIELPENLAAFESRFVFFPGSTLGNFEPKTQERILKNAMSLVGKGGHLIIGLDRKNSIPML